MMPKVIWPDGRVVRVGDAILIERMGGEPGYAGRSGAVTSIDDSGAIHGTWGGLAIMEGDVFHVFHCESVTKER